MSEEASVRLARNETGTAPEDCYLRCCKIFHVPRDYARRVDFFRAHVMGCDMHMSWVVTRARHRKMPCAW